jgi:TonB-dependent receptor
MKKSTLILIFSVFILNLFSNITNGTIIGTVIDEKTNEPIFAANVYVEGTTIGVTTDFDGNFSLNVEKGEYTIVVSSMGYTMKKMEHVIVNPGKEVILNVKIATEAHKVEEVVVKRQRNTRGEVALMNIQKKSVNVIDGVSAESFSKSGDGNVASAVKRVTGVSIEGGKYVYVRGLGDRYTKTILNGMTIPGLNPDKNTVQMDLFPTNLIDNIVVYKSFSPDLPGDFTGGMVDVKTKTLPSKQSLNINIGFGYTTGMNFNKDFVLYNQGKTDFSAFAGNERALQFSPNTVIPDETANNPVLTDLSKGFSKELGVKKNAQTFLNQSYGISYGNKYNKGKMTYGLNLALNYSNSYKFYNDVYQGVFFKDTEDASNYNLDKREVTKGSLGQNEVLWSGLLGGAMNFDKTSISATLFHSQNGVGRAAAYISQNYDETNATLYKDVIDYSQKSVTNLLLAGKHDTKNEKFNVNWKLAPSYSKIVEPDVRSTKLSYDADKDEFSLQLGDGAGIDRYFRDLNEVNLASNLDFTYKFNQWNAKESKLKVGISNTYKVRDYSILHYQFEKTSDFNSFTEDPNDILTEENYWDAENQSGLYVKGNQNLDNAYNSIYNIAGAYIMNELPITSRFKATYGLRIENAIIKYNGYYENKSINKLVHNEFAFLPSVNLSYKLIKDMNLRGSYSRTVARPSFKEKSNAHIDDPISQTVFIGNLDLKEAYIHNADLRWEYFFKSGEIISLSGFFKHFKNPIEMVPFQLSPNNVQPKNVNEAFVYGAELEFKKKLTKKESKVKVDVGTNLTYIYSQVYTKDVVVDENGTTEFDIRNENARTGEAISTFRSMQGQSPYIINAFANLGFDSLGLEFNVSYNVQGEKLAIVGSGIVPDVYEDPFHSLNFKASYTIGKKDQMKLSFSAKNLLNDNFEQYYKSYNADKEIYNSYSRGMSFNLGFTYRFL